MRDGPSSRVLITRSLRVLAHFEPELEPNVGAILAPERHWLFGDFSCLAAGLAVL